MSVEILNTKAYDGHVAQIDAVVRMAQAQGWDEPDGQSMSVENLVSEVSPEEAAPQAPANTPDFKPK